MNAQIRGQMASHIAVVALYGLVTISNLEIAGMAYLLCERVKLALQVEWASVVNLAVSSLLFLSQAYEKLINTYTVCDVAWPYDRTSIMC